MHIDVRTQIYKHLPVGMFTKDTIHHAESIFDKAVKLSACIPEGSFCRAHLSTSGRAHIQNIIWTFSGIFQQRCRDGGLINRTEAEDRMSGCDRESAALILNLPCLFLLSCLSLLTQTMPTSLKYHLCLCVRAGQTHRPGRSYLLYLSSFKCGASQPTARGQIHNRCRISPDNHCGAAGKCTTSKQRECGCMFVAYPQFPVCTVCFYT